MRDRNRVSSGPREVSDRSAAVQQTNAEQRNSITTGTTSHEVMTEVVSQLPQFNRSAGYVLLRRDEYGQPVFQWDEPQGFTRQEAAHAAVIYQALGWTA